MKITCKEEYEEAKTEFYYETCDMVRGACMDLASADDYLNDRPEKDYVDHGQEMCDILLEMSLEYGTEDDQDEFSRLSSKFNQHNGGDQDDYDRLACCVKEFAVHCDPPKEDV